MAAMVAPRPLRCREPLQGSAGKDLAQVFASAAVIDIGMDIDMDIDVDIDIDIAIAIAIRYRYRCGSWVYIEREREIWILEIDMNTCIYIYVCVWICCVIIYTSMHVYTTWVHNITLTCIALPCIPLHTNT